MEIDPVSDTTELAALTEAVEEARKDRFGVDRQDMRKWLLKIAAGAFDVEPPLLRPF